MFAFEEHSRYVTSSQIWHDIWFRGTKRCLDYQQYFNKLDRFARKAGNLRHELSAVSRFISLILTVEAVSVQRFIRAKYLRHRQTAGNGGAPADMWLNRGTLNVSGGYILPCFH